MIGSKMHAHEGRRLPRLMIVGAFPPQGTRIFGGVITSCRLLQESSLSQRTVLTLIDSTQVSNPPPGLGVRAWRAFVRTIRYLAVFSRARPEAVLLFCSGGASVFEKGAMAWYARMRGVPALLFPRGGRLMDSGRGAISRFILRKVFSGAAVVLCQGPAWKRFATDVIQFQASRCVVIPNWSATPTLLLVGRQRRQDHNQCATVLFVGCVEYEKGVQELLEAFSNVAFDRRVCLHIVGDGHAMEFVREYVSANALQSRVRLSGWLEGDGLVSAYREADVFVLPSWAEGLPNAMIEAMAAGLPVVVTSVGNIPDVVEDRKEALLVEPQDVDGLTKALLSVLDDVDLRASLGAAGHSLAAREFAIEAAVDRIMGSLNVAGVDVSPTAISSHIGD